MVPAVVLLIFGLVALGMPRVTRRSRRRAWHPWIQGGWLPLLLGLLVGAWLTPATEDTARLRPVLALATGAAGLLIGTQLRIAYLARAGRAFLGRHTQAAVVSFVAVAVPSAILLWGAGWLNLADAISWAAVLGGLMVCTSQRPPAGVEMFHASHRDVVLGHVAPAGWWNLIAVAAAGMVMVVVPVSDDPLVAVLPWWAVIPVRIGLPIFIGMSLGWLAARARNRDEVGLCLLVVVGMSAGLALILGGLPLFTGLLVGAVFANVALGRAAMVERMLEDLEQPAVITSALLGGLALGAVVAEASQWWPWALAGGWLVIRWALRRHLSPSSATVSSARERTLQPLGATAILLLASLGFLGHGAELLLMPMAAAAGVALLVAQVAVARRPYWDAIAADHA